MTNAMLLWLLFHNASETDLKAYNPNNLVTQKEINSWLAQFFNGDQ